MGRGWTLIALVSTVACVPEWRVADADGDGYTIIDGDCWDQPEGAGGSSLGGADINPGAVDDWYDGLDADCGGEDDYDADGDGFVADAHLGLSTYGLSASGGLPGGDCWDDPQAGPPGAGDLEPGSVYPGAVDVWYDGVDSDCAGDSDFDADGDGFDLGYGGDCDDTSPDINPDALEVCDDLDNDCDGQIDALDSSMDPDDLRLWYVDSDGDGYGSEVGAQLSCSQPLHSVARAGDCDDDDETRYPGALEICGDGVVNDCDAIEADCRLEDATTDSVPIRLAGEASGDGLGGAAAAGDVDGDGQLDLLIGADDAGGAGRAYLLAGPLDVGTSLEDAALIVEGEESGDSAGRALALVDIDGDAYDDVVVGSTNGGYGLGRGMVGVLYGPLSGAVELGSADWLISGSGNYEYFGSVVASVGDLDGDGVGDLVGASYLSDHESTNDGVVYVFTDGGSGADTEIDGATAVFFGASSGDRFGTSVAAGGDVDGDGVHDLWVGATRADDAGSDSGAAYLFLGPVSGVTPSDDADATWVGDDAGDYAGASTAGVQDLDGDGLPELAVGALRAGTDSAGAVYLVGSADVLAGGGLADAAVIVEGVDADQQVGISVALTVDLDDDGQGELLIGQGENSSCGSSSAAGAAWLFYSGVAGAMSTNDADVAFRGASAPECAGAVVAGPGDLTGDGLGDLVLGAVGYDDFAGAAFVVEGVGP